VETKTRVIINSLCNVAARVIILIVALFLTPFLLDRLGKPGFGIIALIIIPQMLAAERRSSESALRGDLRSLRVAIEHFHADSGGYPPRLDDVFAWSGDHVSAAVDGAHRDLDLESYRGPYLRTGDMLLPLDPFTDERDWEYNSATGEVHSNCDLIGRDGTPYSSW